MEPQCLIKSFNLNEKQDIAFKKIMDGENLFITAPAGTGKTYLIECYRKYRSRMVEINPNNFKLIGITSTTGVSALLINGTTLHSFLGIGLGLGSVEDTIKEVVRRKRTDVWLKLHTLIVDEVSMLSPMLFDKLEEVARTLRKNDKPFGGIQLILSGDLLQLPVVKCMDLIVDAKCWETCIGSNVVFLDKVIRQTEAHFISVLHKVRVGVVDDTVKELLGSCMDKEEIMDGVRPTKLFCLRKDVQDHNDGELYKLKVMGERFFRFRAMFSFSAGVGEQQQEFYKNRLDRDHNTPLDLKLCNGAQVVLTVNLNVEKGLVNGSRGVVVGLDKYPIVRFKNGLELKINPNHWDILDDHNRIVGAYVQIPLRVAFALTIHSSQGSSLDSASIDFNGTFEYGQVYTALSRLRDSNSLTISNLDFTKIRSHPKALKFYNV